MRTFKLTMLLCALFVFGGITAQVKVTGVVTDGSAGGVLPGANVYEEGTNNGTATDGNGNYSISVANKDAVLVYSFAGMQTQKIVVGDRTRIDVALTDGVDLDQAVVTALGLTKSKKALGYAVNEVGGDDLVNSQEANVIQGLAAKAPGVVVTGSGGTPGSSSKVVIRGNGTFTGNNAPLIVIDGVPVDNRTTQTTAGDFPFNQNLSGVNASNRALDIDPNDIESVTVLKGPAAAALYGARAGNGAIVYTTKRGKLGMNQGLTATYTSSVEAAVVNKLPEMQNVYGGGSDGAAAVYADPGPDGLFFTADDVAFGTQQSWGPKLDTTDLEVFDNNDAFFETGLTFENSLNIAAANEKAAVRMSVGNFNQKGTIPHTGLNRTSFRVNVDSKFSERLTVSASANYINTQSTLVQNGSNLSGIMLGLLRAPNTYDLSDFVYDNGYQRSYFVVYDNPFYTALENPFTSNVNRLVGNVFTKYQISDNWSASYRLGIDTYSDKRRQIYAVSAWGDDNVEGLGQVNMNNLFSTRLYGDLLVNYTKQLNEKLGMNVLFGNNFTSNKFDDDFFRGRNLSVPNFYNLSSASDLFASNATINDNSYAFFVNAEFDYDNFLFLNLTGRNEWSSTFELPVEGTDIKNNFFYPSASLSFVFTELMGESSWLDFGKLRLSNARVGISPQPYSTRNVFFQPTFTDGFTNGLGFPFGSVNGFSQGNVRLDPNLRPEQMIGNEVGVYASFFDGLFDVDLTYYNQKSIDLLGNSPLPGTSGFTSEYTNFGEMVNKGIEALVNIKPIRGDDFKWNLSVNWARNISEVTKLTEGVEEINLESAFQSIQSFAIVGQPYGALYGSRWLRNDAGDLVIGQNGLPLYDPENGNVGDPNPDWTLGITNSFSYKEWNFGFLIDIRKGGDIWNGTYARLMQYGRPIETVDRDRTYVIEGVLADEDGNPTSTANDIEIDARTYFSNYLGDAGGAAEQHVEDGGWVRLRSVNLGRSFNIKNNKYFKSISFNLSARNLWLKTDYRGVDPETSLTGAGSNLGGFDYFNNPGTKSYRLSVSLNF